MNKISEIPIALFCGKLDMLSSPDDYLWLKSQLLETKSMIYFKEFDLGHLGVLMPKDRTHFYEMLELMKAYHPAYKHENFFV